MKKTNKIISVVNLVLIVIFAKVIFDDSNEQLTYSGSTSFLENGIRTKIISDVTFSNDTVDIKEAIYQNRKIIATTNATYTFLYNSKTGRYGLKKEIDQSYSNVAFPILRIFKFTDECLVIKPKRQLAINNIRFVCIE